MRVFGEDNSGTLSFFEWFQATNVKNMTCPEDKLSWIFMAFDSDAGGSIDVDEIRDIVVWMFRFAGIEEDPDLLESWGYPGGPAFLANAVQKESYILGLTAYG